MLALFNKKKEESMFKEVDSVDVVYYIPEDLEVQVKMMELTEVDIKRLFLLKPFIEKHSKEFVTQFYEALQEEKSLLKIINKHSNVQKLGDTLYRHINKIFSGKIDTDYFENRVKIAHIHVKIGLGTKWYLNAFQHLMNLITNKLCNEITNKDDLYQSISSIQKIFSLEQQLVLDAYELRELDIQNKNRAEKEIIHERMMMTANELSSIAEETGASLEDLISQFKNIHKLTNESQKSIKRVQNLSDNGKSKLEEEKKTAELISEKVGVINKDIDELFLISNNISNVVDVVSSIANQINLLSLNATIESAHAGEHGKGFSVVANEIRNLSNLTKSSTKDISALIQNISSKVKVINNSIKEFNKNVEDNKVHTVKTLMFFDEIVHAVKDSKEQTDCIFNEIKQSEDVLNDLNQATNNIMKTADILVK